MASLIAGTNVNEMGVVSGKTFYKLRYNDLPRGVNCSYIIKNINIVLGYQENISDNLEILV